ncbi:N-acetylneuraminate synthase family protein [Eggerthella lenta]|uniref:N-acetylneuraminate synthase family protein n=2 Tax=cellular organisms TaxID=131567 RepID=UPI0031B64A6A
MIVSVGAGDLAEIERAVETVRKVNDCPIVLCHCVLEYPTPYEHANLRRISSLAKEFPDVIVGYSDHCKPDESADVIKAAYALGAHVVEKHFTLDKKLPGNDHYHAMDPHDARKIIEGVRFVETLLGNEELGFCESEAKARRNARRSIVTAVRIAQGDVITREMLTFKRPGTGISPQDIDEVIGRIALSDISEDTTVTREMIC